MNDIERAERLKEIFKALYEVNKSVPIVVEGKNDAKALRKIGLVGDIITLHKGEGLYEFCENIDRRFHKIILLLDWDGNGKSLHNIVSRHLSGSWEEFASFRETIKILCQKHIKDIEGIPALLERLVGEEVSVGETAEKEDLLMPIK
ncbi:hypothetical protein M1N66_03765 [Thermodesulfovibrionales bacterium]|nr:hypothetical protein [Thermodesulfovibrionales bacterium]